MMTEEKAIKIIEKQRINSKKYEKKLKAKDLKKFKKYICWYIKKGVKRGVTIFNFNELGLMVAKKQTLIKDYELDDAFNKLISYFRKKGYSNIKVEKKDTNYYDNIKTLVINIEDKVKVKH